MRIQDKFIRFDNEQHASEKEHGTVGAPDQTTISRSGCTCVACVLQDDLLTLYDHTGRKHWRNVDDPTLVFDIKDETARN